MSTARPVSQRVPVDAAPPRTGRPRNPAVDAAILQAARAVLEDVGCGAFTMEGVATRAGVGKQALYRRWPSKGDLLIDLYYRDDMTDPDVDEPGLSLAAALGRFLDANMQRLYSPWHCNLLRSLATSAQDDGGVRQAFLTRHHATAPRERASRVATCGSRRACARRSRCRHGSRLRRGRDLVPPAVRPRADHPGPPRPYPARGAGPLRRLAQQ